MKWAGGAVPGAIVPGTGLNPQWSILRVEAVSGDPNARKMVVVAVGLHRAASTQINDEGNAIGGLVVDPALHR